MNTELIWLLIIGLSSGVLSGLFGIGGGVIIVPALMLLLGFDQLLANGTSLAALLFPVGILGAIAYYRAGLIQMKTSAALALGLCIGVWGGASLALDLNEEVLRGIYGFFLLFVSWRFIEPRRLWKDWRNRGMGQLDPSGENQDSHQIALGWYFVVGMLAGVLAGLFGIGGGVIIIPALILLGRLDAKQAAGTSLGALLPPVGLPGVLLYAKAGAFSLQAALPVALGLLTGAFFGAQVTIRLSPGMVKHLYGALLFLIAVKFILDLTF